MAAAGPGRGISARKGSATSPERQGLERTRASETRSQPTPPPMTVITNQSLQSLATSSGCAYRPRCAGTLFDHVGGTDEDVEACRNASSVSCGVKPLDSRKASRLASGDEATDGSRRNDTAELTRSCRIDIAEAFSDHARWKPCSSGMGLKRATADYRGRLSAPVTDSSIELRAGRPGRRPPHSRSARAGRARKVSTVSRQPHRVHRLIREHCAHAKGRGHDPSRHNAVEG